MTGRLLACRWRFMAWTRCTVRTPRMCWVSGVLIRPGREAFRPTSGNTDRARRVSAQAMERLVREGKAEAPAGLVIHP